MVTVIAICLLFGGMELSVPRDWTITKVTATPSSVSFPVTSVDRLSVASAKVELRREMIIGEVISLPTKDCNLQLLEREKKENGK